jgi:glutamate-1-semialdehyde 2,1-aminomutase
MTAGFIDEIYIKRTPNSKKLYDEALKYLPAGVSYAIRHFEPYPFYVLKGKGNKVWDVDGNEYTDYWMGHGAILMGHAYTPVIQAAKEQLELGTHLGFANEWEVKHAKQICKMIPSAQMVRPTNSGTEANMYAIRLARAYTKRKKIVKFEGHWHGGYDALHKGINYPYETLPSAGLHPELLNDTVVVPFNYIEKVKNKIKGFEKDIACFIIEPVATGGGVIPADREFLKALRELCDQIGSLLIFDEVVTGFRLAPGGAQEFYNVKPDLTVLGKIVGGSIFPAGAFCGRSDIMEKIDHLIYKEPSLRSFHGGTYTGNPLVSRAGYTLLSELDEKRDSIYPYLNKLGEKMKKRLSEIFEKDQLAHVTQIASLFGIHFTKQRPSDVATAQKTKDVELTKKFHAFMLANSIIFLSPDTIHCMLSYAHTENDIETFASLTEDFVKRTRVNQ